MYLVVKFLFYLTRRKNARLPSQNPTPANSSGSLKGGMPSPQPMAQPPNMVVFWVHTSTGLSQMWNLLREMRGKAQL